MWIIARLRAWRDLYRPPTRVPYRGPKRKWRGGALVVILLAVLAYGLWFKLKKSPSAEAKTSIAPVSQPKLVPVVPDTLDSVSVVTKLDPAVADSICRGIMNSWENERLTLEAKERRNEALAPSTDFMSYAHKIRWSCKDFALNADTASSWATIYGHAAVISKNMDKAAALRASRSP